MHHKVEPWGNCKFLEKMTKDVITYFEQSQEAILPKDNFYFLVCTMLHLPNSDFPYCFTGIDDNLSFKRTKQVECCNLEFQNDSIRKESQRTVWQSVTLKRSVVSSRQSMTPRPSV